MLPRLLLVAIVTFAGTSVSHALITVTKVGPKTATVHDVDVAVERHKDNTMTFKVSVRCPENQHVVLDSHVCRQ